MMLVILMGTGMTSCEFFSDNPISPRLKVRVSSMEVQVGASRKCNVFASTRAKLLYSSSDESIATVDEKGIVTGVSEGDAVITVVATKKDIDIFYDESAEIAVKVVPKGSKTDEDDEDEVVPVNFTTAVDQLKIADQEGAYITFWFTHKGGLYYATFKKVGEDYVLQDDVASTRVTDRVFTRGEENELENYKKKLKVELERLMGNGGKLFFGVEENIEKDDGSTGTIAVLQTIIETKTGNIEQITENVNTRVVAVNAGVQAPNHNLVEVGESIALDLIFDEGKSPEGMDRKGMELVSKLNRGEIDTWMLENLKTNTGKMTLNTIAEINQQVNQANGVADVTHRADAEKVTETLKEAEKKVELRLQDLIDAGSMNFNVNEFKILTKEMVLQVDQSEKIKYKIGPDNAVCTIEWTSDNEKVATVDENGVVLAKKAGNATITGRPRTRGKYLWGSIDCTVKEGTKPEPKAGEIKFGEKSVSQTWSTTATENVYKQEATVTGDAVPTYSISNNSCGATIDEKSGQVTFTKAGSVMVTAKVNNTSAYTYQTNTASYTLTVKEPEPGGIDPHDGFGNGGDPLK